MQITKEQVHLLAEQFLNASDRTQGKQYELIRVEISAEQEILVEIDSLQGVDVEACEQLNRYLASELDKVPGVDYALEVGSVSLTDPFVTHMQYEKHIGNPVVVVLPNGDKRKGQLVQVEEDAFAIQCEEMVAVEGKKRKQKQVREYRFAFQDVAQTYYDLKV